MLFCTFVIICVIAIYVYQIVCRKQRVATGLKDIPTENGLPVLGVVNKISDSLGNYLLNLSHKHGPIYKIKLGMRDVVVLNTFEYIKAALIDNGETFSGRSKGVSYTFGADNAGLAFIDGSVWIEQRSFVLKCLKDFGIGKAKSVEIVQDECLHLLADLERFEGKGINIYDFMSIYSINVISKFVLNKRFTLRDPELEIFEKYMKSLATEKDFISNLFLMFPIIERNTYLMKLILKIAPRNSLLDDCHDMFRNEIKEHSKKLDFNSEGEDLTDLFLIHQRRLEESSGNVKSFTEFQLVRNILELIGSSIDSLAVLVWSFTFMAMYPDIQNKVYEEIMNKIGNDRLVTAVDKMSLIYTQAVMDEILRLGSPDPFTIFHRTLNDVSVKGYYIPKDTLIIPNLLACNLNPETWEHSLEFYPEHFLIHDDNGELKYKPREELIPFSMGKRRCMGESLGRMEYFIFFTSIIRQFRVIPAVLNESFDLFHANYGLVRIPTIQDFIFENRQ